MYNKSELKSGLLGIFEITLFMKSGIDRFDDGRAAAMRSFFWPVVLFPFVLMAVVMLSSGYSTALLLPLHGVRMLVTFLMFLAVVFIFCRQYERTEYFYKFITVSNWANISGVLMIAPILIALSMGWGSVDDFKTYAIFVTMAGYVYMGYILTYTLRIPWELGGMIAIVGMAIDQSAFDLAVYFRDTLSAI